MKMYILPSLKALSILSLLTGVIYPVFVTVLAQLFFQHQADGSLIVKDGKIIGSVLIGQKFQSDRYFWPRPSAIDYNPMPSGASNLGPTSKTLSDSVKERKKRFIIRNLLPPDEKVPKEMLFASGSGVDPHISPQSALLQVNRVSRARGFDVTKSEALKKLIEHETEYPQFMVFGQPCVNVLKLNLALDEM